MPDKALVLGTVPAGLSFVTAVGAPVIGLRTRQVTDALQVEEPVVIEHGVAERVPDGGGTPTETVAVAPVLPPGPTQVRLKEVVADKGLII